MPKPVSLTAAAATLGVHRNTLAGWIDRGCPFVTKADRDRGAEWQLDTAAVFKWRVDEAVKDAVAGYQTESGGVSKDEADRRRAVALAIVAEIEADTALKAVVLRVDVEAAMADFCQALRSGLTNAGATIANRTANMNRPTDIRQFCVEVINKAYGAAEQYLQERWAGDLPEEADGVTPADDED